MTPALTPRRALDYLRELSTDVRDGVVLGADGSLLAGSAALAGPARDLLAAAANGVDAIQVDLARGAVYAVRSPAYAVVVTLGPLALPRLALHDLRTVVAELDGRSGAS